MKKSTQPKSHASLVKSGRFAHTSKAKSPCQIVWEVASNNRAMRRKDVIDLCMKQGVAFYTARTQYQLWRAAGQADAKSAAARSK